MTERDIIPDDDSAAAGDVAGFAWYQVSSSAAWPTLSGARQRRGARGRSSEQSTPSGPAVVPVVSVGTYEWAIERLLRQMRIGRLCSRQYYLHRVTVALLPSEIASGVCNEAADGVHEAGYDRLHHGECQALRYVTTYDAPGSVALSIVSSAIETIQSIPLPSSDFAAGLPDSLRRRVSVSGAPATSGRSESVTSTLDAEDLDAMLAQRHLSSVGARVVDAFDDAMTAVRDRAESAAAYRDTYRTYATVLTGADELIARLRRCPGRDPIAWPCRSDSDNSVRNRRSRTTS
ncbi:hypothetical protein AAFP35_17600 [Gordonia sp. CPCC 206044]|uniref:hypothetical protein n=1 Tax=Gordonia sp. CPCC 206044 TaxID=3140793 RepID=UPI003AF3A1DA